MLGGERDDVVHVRDNIAQLAPIGVVFTVLYFRYLDAKAEGRLDDGIDPPWLKEVQPSAPAKPAGTMA